VSPGAPLPSCAAANNVSGLDGEFTTRSGMAPHCLKIVSTHDRVQCAPPKGEHHQGKEVWDRLANRSWPEPEAEGSRCRVSGPFRAGAFFGMRRPRSSILIAMSPAASFSRLRAARGQTAACPYSVSQSVHPSRKGHRRRGLASTVSATWPFQRHASVTLPDSTLTMCGPANPARPTTAARPSSIPVPSRIRNLVIGIGF